MHQESNASEVEFHNSYFTRIFTKKEILEKLGFRVDDPIRTRFLHLLIEEVVDKGQWPAFLESWSH
jgi:hypothetical protein